MNKIKILILIVISFTSTVVFGQSKSVAERYFKEYSYVRSAELYKSIVTKGDSSQTILERLGDSYYNNANIEEAKIWYAVLFNKYKNSVAPDYYYKYAQTLKSLGDTDLSKNLFNEYAALATGHLRSKYILEGLKLQEDKEFAFENIINLDINTKYSDFNGFIYNDILSVFSTKPGEGSKIYKWNKQPFLNIYQGAIENSNKVGKLKTITGDINTKYHEATLVITKDGKTMYFTRDNSKGNRLKKAKDKTTNLKLYKAQLEDGEWTNVKELPFNNDEYSVGHPTLSVDEKELYFISDMPGSIGGTDIYMATIKGGNNYSTPINLGNGINTEGMEMFPFISDDNTLYFSSNGRSGLGLLDIYKVELESFSEDAVYNLGSPINSNMDDFAFTLKNKESGYFSSNREGGKGDDDIYSFNIEEIVCLESIAGVVYDKKTNKPILGATVQLIDALGEVKESAITEADGVYIFESKACDLTFTVRADKDDYQSDMKDITLLSENGETRLLNLELTPLIKEVEEVRQIVINPIYFDLDKSFIRPDAEYELENVIAVLRIQPSMVIKIESHTDCRAPNAYNEKLSDRRAKSTRDYIISRGVSSSRIQSAIGYGESRLVNHCSDNVKCTEEQHQENRRSLFIIVKD